MFFFIPEIVFVLLRYILAFLKKEEKNKDDSFASSASCVIMEE